MAYNNNVGWIRVVEEGKSVAVTAVEERLDGNKLYTNPISAISAKPTNGYKINEGSYCQSEEAISTGFKCNGVQIVYFINVTETPTQVGMCQEDYADCNPIEMNTIAPRAMIGYVKFKKYMFLKSMFAPSIGINIFYGEGRSRTFDASSSITFGSPVDPKAK